MNLATDTFSKVNWIDTRVKLNNAPEKNFEREFAKLCQVANMLYIKIPDPIMTKERLSVMARRGISDEPLRPFDGILVKKDKVYCLEFKYQYNKLSKHQEEYQNAINAINQCFFVVRKIKRKSGICYQIQYNNNVILETEKIEDLIIAFKED